jgi:hypothetical protein
VVEPEGGFIEGTAYSGGSLRDGPIVELGRCGWAFGVLDDSGRIVASAHGVPPPWIKDIGGAEAWAALQVGLRAVPGKVKLMIDCQPCVAMIHGGLTAATTANRPLARVNAMVLSVLEDVPNDKVVWMPAHKSKQMAGHVRCGNGELLTMQDIKGNAEADRLAKLAVQQHRVDPAEVLRWERLCNQTMGIAKWIARATWAANNCDEAPFRDTEASQWRADVSRKEAKARKAAVAAGLAMSTGGDELPSLRGHNPVQVLQLSGIRSGWRCTICRKMSSSKKLLTGRRCMGCHSRNGAPLMPMMVPSRRSAYDRCKCIGGCRVGLCCGALGAECTRTRRRKGLLRRAMVPHPDTITEVAWKVNFGNFVMVFIPKRGLVCLRLSFLTSIRS